MNIKKLRVRQLILIVVDTLSIVIALYGSLVLRFDGTINQEYISNINQVLPIIIILNLIVFIWMKMYKSLWQFASMVELFNIVCATIVGSLINIAIFEITNNDLPESCYFLYFLLLTLCLGFTRFTYRLLRIYKLHIHPKSRRELQRVMIIGAGLAGEKTYREIVYNPTIFKQVVCFIDDDVNKQKKQIHNVSVYGGRDKIIEAAKKFKIDEILLAIPSIDRQDMADILNICKETKCQIKRLPGIYQMINGDIHISDYKDVEIQDLLGREPIKVNLEDIMRYVNGKVVMVTGGGG